MTRADAARVVLLAGAFGETGTELARALLAEGAGVAVALPRGWQVDKLRERLDAGASALVGVVAPRDAQAAAGFVKGANDALGPITEFCGVATLLREREPGREPAGDLDELLDANLHASATLARAVLPSLRRRGQGRLRFRLPDPGRQDLSATCRASLAALSTFVDGLAEDADGLRIEREVLAD